MPTLKINGLATNNGFTDAVIEWEENSIIEISDENECLVARFQPDDFLAVADAYIAFKKRTDEKKRSENEDNQPA